MDYLSVNENLQFNIGKIKYLQGKLTTKTMLIEEQQHYILIGQKKLLLLSSLLTSKSSSLGCLVAWIPRGGRPAPRSLFC